MQCKRWQYRTFNSSSCNVILCNAKRMFCIFLWNFLLNPAAAHCLQAGSAGGSIGNDGNKMQCKKKHNTIYNAKSCNVILCNAKLYFASSCGTSYSIQLLQTLLAGPSRGNALEMPKIKCNAMQAVAMSNYAMQKNVLHLLLELLTGAARCLPAPQKYIGNTQILMKCNVMSQKQPYARLCSAKQSNVLNLLVDLFAGAAHCWPSCALEIPKF